MRTVIVILGLITACFTGVNAQHENQQMKMDHSTMKNGDMVKHYDVSTKFQEQLGNVVKKNQNLNDAFVGGETGKISASAKDVKSSLASVDMELLSGDAHMDWMNYLNAMNGQLDKIIAAKEVAAQREAFSNYNEALYKSLKAFGVEDQPVYYQHCPMANNGKGANWLSLEKVIKNPYFGNKMLSCGVTKETIE